MTKPPKAKGLPPQTLSNTPNTTTAARLKEKSKNGKGCCCLADTIAELGLSEYEIDRLLEAISYLANAEQQRWDCARISVRQAIAWMKHNGLATPAMAKWRCV